MAAATAKGHPSPSLFSTLDKNYHDQIKRAVNSAFSVTSLVNYEPYVDHVISEFLTHLRSRFADNPECKSFNMVQWLHYYALDVIGEVVYGQAYGFLKTGTDVDNMDKDTQKMQDYLYLVRLPCNQMSLC